MGYLNLEYYYRACKGRREPRRIRSSFAVSSSEELYNNWRLGDQIWSNLGEILVQHEYARADGKGVVVLAKTNVDRNSPKTPRCLSSLLELVHCIAYLLHIYLMLQL